MRLVTSRKNRTCKKCIEFITCGDPYYPQRRNKAICFLCGYKLKFKWMAIIMANKPANAEQVRWMESITDYINENGLGVLYGVEYEYDVRMQRHHVTGRASKQDKVAIGHYFIIPVPFALHDPNMKHEHHVGHCKKAFVRRFGTQRGLFKRMYLDMKQQGYIVPNSHVFSAIMGTAA